MLIHYSKETISYSVSSDYCVLMLEVTFDYWKILQNHEWMKTAEKEKVDIAGWVCRTMELCPTTPTRTSQN